MKRILSVLLISFSAISVVLADLPPLRTQDTVRVQAGRVRFSAVLADDNGEVYIEVPQNMVAKVAGQAHFNFDGFLLAPNIISLPQKFPRARSREVVSFDFLADDNSPVRFSDKFYRVPLKRRLFTENEKSKMITVYVPIFTEENVQKPELWYFDDQLTDDESDDEWRRVGGVFEDTSDPNVQLFSAVITSTGLYTVVDRRPFPKENDNVDPAIIEAGEDSPFPSVEVLPNQDDIPIDESFDQEDPLENPEEESAFPGAINLTPGESEEGEIPATAPLPQEANEGVVPVTPNDQFEDEIPSLEQQSAELEPGNDELAPSVIFESEPVTESVPEDDGRLPALTEEDILAEIQRINAEQGTDAPIGPSLQTNTFEGDNLPRTGTQKSNAPILLAFFILAGSVYWYRREKKEMKEETR